MCRRPKLLEIMKNCKEKEIIPPSQIIELLAIKDLTINYTLAQHALYWFCTLQRVIIPCLTLKILG
jgi:hypothetical protein